MSFDLQRLPELREFLVTMRSRLLPIDVGLPDTARRRVPGLRREEVAELLGVSSIWYRWFESGREVRVSEQFIARLSGILRLNAQDVMTLYRLALPGLYRAESALRGEETSLHGAAAHVSLRSSAEIETVARDHALARERFLTERSISPGSTRARVARSWERSQTMGVDAACNVAAFSVHRNDDLREKHEINERLLRASQLVTAYLSEQLFDTGYVVVVTDATGCLLHISGELQIRKRLSRLGFEPGGDWGERSAGTNAIGTAIADGRPLQLMGAEHYCDGWVGLTCTAAPIQDTKTAKVLGILDITADYRAVRPHLLGVVSDCAMQIEEAFEEAG